MASLEYSETNEMRNTNVFCVCEAHKSAKKGICPSCKQCRKCIPSNVCGNPEKHVTSRMGRRKTSPNSIAIPQGMNGASSLNPLSLTTDPDIIQQEMTLPCAASKNMSPMEKLLSCLGISEALLHRIPTEGIRKIGHSDREFRRAKRLLTTIMKGTINLLVQDEEDRNRFLDLFEMSSLKSNVNASKLQKLLVRLAFFGNRKVSTTCQSVLSKGLPRSELKTLLAEEYDIQQQNALAVAPLRRGMGKVKFASLRQTYELLLQGKDIPIHDYTFRVDSTKVAAIMKFLQNSLQLKPGMTRDVSIANHVFQSLPVYERGGKSIESLFQAYREAVSEKFLVGMPTFRDIVKLLTKRGEAKAGLSTYYIKLRDTRRIFVAMIMRLKEIVSELNISINRGVLDAFITEWSSIERFVLWDYSNGHLKITDEDRIHCCSFALGGECGHVHRMNSLCCDKCANAMTFFRMKIAPFIQNHIVDHVTDIAIKKEIESMVSATDRFDLAVKHYLGHRLRAKIQFAEIEKVKEWLKSDPTSKMLLVIDHKQKVLQMKHREGQVEYYGKHGMSVLGVMQVQWVSRDSLWGYEYAFVDCVVKGYAAQDNVQVCGCLETIINTISTKHSMVREICIQSDNATCFASQELIPYLYHLNNTEQNKIKVIRWVYTEAQTGRGRLDTHFSYVNVVLRSYVESGNDINVEEDIAKAISYRNGIAGTTVLLLDGSRLDGKALSKPFKARLTGSRKTHEVRWYKNKIEIIKSPGITKPEVIHDSRLQQYKKNTLNVTIGFSFTSEKPALFVAAESRSRILSSVGSSKSVAYEDALNQVGMIQDISRQNEIRSSTTPIEDCALHGWAQYPGNTGGKLTRDVMNKLRQLYRLGKEHKKRKVSAERALQILVDDVLFDNWYERLNISVPKIKAFFSMSPAQQIKLIEKTESTSENTADVDEFQRAVETNENNLVSNERLADTITVLI